MAGNLLHSKQSSGTGSSPSAAMSLQSSSSMRKTASDKDLSTDSVLFETPSDLICPITHELFRDPVINSVGQVYERDAIDKHLSKRAVDPVSMLPLENTALTPVFVIKSRALEFRETTAKACVDRVCSVNCKEPIKYLRRAAELCHNVSIRIPGLSHDVIQYLLTHASAAYDFLALQQFAQGLRSAGYIDQATNIYYKLLEFGDDKSQQAQALKQCLSCWASEDEVQVIPKLAQFIDTQQAFTAGQIVDIMLEAKLSEQLILQVCEHLLSKQASAAQDASVSKYSDLLLKYTQLKCSRLEGEVQKLREEVQAVSASDSRSLASVSKEDQPVHLEHGPKARVTRFLVRRRRGLLSAVVAGLSLWDSKPFPVKVAWAGSLLMLINRSPERQ